jgi:hypothetical protein
MPPLCIHVLTWYRHSFRLKNAGPPKQEHARLEVENAEDDLVQKTEVAITLMKAVLDNVRGDLCHNFFWLNCLRSPNPLRISMSSSKLR